MKKIKLEFELYVLLWPEGLRASRHNLAEKGTGSSLPLGQPKNGDQSGERGSRVFDKVILVDSGHGVPRSIEWREEAFLPQGHITTTIRPGFPGPFPVLVPGKPGQLVTLLTCEQNNRAMCGTAQQASRYQRQVLSKPAWV